MILLNSRLLPADGAWGTIRKHLNFFRIHIIFFTFTPLVFSGIFYASNGEFHIAYIDALYNSVSAMTVCGLATVDLSSLTGWQQVILFIQMCLGSPVLVSWVMVYTRRRYFAKKFKRIIEAEMSQRAFAKSNAADVEPNTRPLLGRIASLFIRPSSLSEVTEESEGSTKDRSTSGRLRADMVRRMEDAPQPVNPSGLISKPGSEDVRQTSNSGGCDGSSDSAEKSAFSEVKFAHPGNPRSSQVGIRSANPHISTRISHDNACRLSDPVPSPIQRYETMDRSGNPSNSSSIPMGRSPTVEFQPNTPSTARNLPRQRGMGTRSRRDRPYFTEAGTTSQTGEEEQVLSPRRSPFNAQVIVTDHTTARPDLQGKNSGFGGFPMPFEIVSRLFERFFPKLQKKLTRTMTIPATTTIGSRNDLSSSKPTPYISFEATVGRNSTFYMLTDEQLEELGGVEYRALNALLWIVPVYHIGIQLISYIVIAPYMSMSRWRTNFEPPMQHRFIPPPWFSLFNVVSAYTNTGMSLVDQSMVPFQKAYPTIFFMILLILAGNTAFPIFLRFMIWILTKIVPSRSRANETLHFLLDHPRRCFIYLFPSHQTWFLLTVLIALNFTDWFFFMVLDIGNPAIEAIPLGTRFAIGLLQAVAVRAAGFGTVPLSALAPAVKVLYATMMYVSVYPIALSVRSTNVYEEQSLGVFHEDEEEDEEEDKFQSTGPRVAVWSRYLAMHARRQLAFDMWWLTLALFLVCIIERPNLDNEANLGWFTIFSIIFELVSAYGTVGLSLGIPTQNYSFSGALRPLSKLIVCFVMLRGRHRGLPVAIDRAVMLPAEFQKLPDYDEKIQLHRQHTRHSTVASHNGDVDEKLFSDDSSELRRRAAQKRSSQDAYVDLFRKKSLREDQG